MEIFPKFFPLIAVSDSLNFFFVCFNTVLSAIVKFTFNVSLDSLYMSTTLHTSSHENKKALKVN